MTKKLDATLKKEGKWFVAECPQLGTISQGSSKKSALENLKEATELYLDEITDPDNQAATVVDFQVA